MKKALKTILSSAAVMLIISFSAINTFAAGKLTLDNNVSAAVNDTVTYTLYLADCEKSVTDMDAKIVYDSNYLELDKDSIDFNGLIGVTANTELDGIVPFCFSTPSSPVDFSKKRPIVTLDFKVLNEGTSSIKYFITDLDCGDIENSSSVRKYTFTCDYVIHSADGDTAVENVTPVLLDNQDKLDEYQGDFINYADGKGEQDADGENHIALKGSEVVDVTKGDKSNTDTDSGTTIIITVIIIIIVLVIGVLLVLRRVLSKSDNNKDEEIEYNDIEDEDEGEE